MSDERTRGKQRIHQVKVQHPAIYHSFFCTISSTNNGTIRFTIDIAYRCSYLDAILDSNHCSYKLPIEDAIKTELPAISKVMIIGDKRKYLTCLITLVQEGSDQEGYSEVLDGVSKSLDYKCVTAAEAASSAKWKAYIEAGIKKYNSSSLVVSNACKVQKFSILPIDFSIETGELGPTTKLVRGKIVEKFAAEIDAMYA